jgi:hypothetical protein
VDDLELRTALAGLDAKLDRLQAAADRILVQIDRMEPFLDMFDNPPPMLAGLMGGRKAKKAAKASANGDG